MFNNGNPVKAMRYLTTQDIVEDSPQVCVCVCVCAPLGLRVLVNPEFQELTLCVRTCVCLCACVYVRVCLYVRLICDMWFGDDALL
jgi:hypothetical protein